MLKDKLDAFKGNTFNIRIWEDLEVTENSTQTANSKRIYPSMRQRY